MPDKRTVVKIGTNKTIYYCCFSLFLMNFSNLHIAFSCMAALKHNFDICWMKLNWLSISTPSNFTGLVVSISLFYIFNLCVVWFPFLLFIIIAWNVSGLAIMLLFLNQSIPNSDSFSSVWRRSFRFLQVTVMVLSFAKLYKSDFVSHKNKSVTKMLNRIGPTIDPCGTPESIVLKETRYTLLIFTLCFRWFK